MNWERIYAVQIQQTAASWGITTHLVVERRDGFPVTADWDTLQQIKNDSLGEDANAIEFYPPESRVVNEVNRRHFFVVPEDFYAWRK